MQRFVRAHHPLLTTISTGHLCESHKMAVCSSVRGYGVLPLADDKEEKDMLHRMMRVDHAGEYGASQIYAGQMAFLSRTQTRTLIQDMWDQEKKHLSKFNEILAENGMRPTLLLPLWNIAGFALVLSGSMFVYDMAVLLDGLVLLFLGRRGQWLALAVEESISEHYNSHIRALMERDPEKYTQLLQMIKEFRDEELEHNDIRLEHDVESVPEYWLMKAIIQTGCKAAIYVSERV